MMLHYCCPVDACMASILNEGFDAMVIQIWDSVSMCMFFETVFKSMLNNLMTQEVSGIYILDMGHIELT